MKALPAAPFFPPTTSMNHPLASVRRFVRPFVRLSVHHSGRPTSLPSAIPFDALANKGSGYVDANGAKMK